MGAGLNFETFISNSKSLSNGNFQAANNIQALNTRPAATPAMQQPPPKQDEFILKNPSGNDKKKNILFYALGLLGAAFFGAGAYKLYLKIKPKPIKRFKQIDDTLYRGAKPTRAQYKNLKKKGIGRVIALNTDPKIKGGNKLEKEIAKSFGIKYTELRMKETGTPGDKQVKTFFKIMDNARKNNEKVYIHCTHGKDRTGLYSAMYEIKYGLSNTEDAIYEMVSMNHNYKKHPQMIEYIKGGRFMNIK